MDIVRDLQVEVRPGRGARRSDGPECLPAPHALSDGHGDIPQMGIGGNRAVIMPDLNIVAESGLVARIGLAFIRIVRDSHGPWKDRKNRNSGPRSKVRAVME